MIALRLPSAADLHRCIAFMLSLAVSSEMRETRARCDRPRLVIRHPVPRTPYPCGYPSLETDPPGDPSCSLVFKSSPVAEVSRGSHGSCGRDTVNRPPPPAARYLCHIRVGRFCFERCRSLRQIGSSIDWFCLEGKKRRCREICPSKHIVSMAGAGDLPSCARGEQIHHPEGQR
ncbi:hypothetical protein B0T22DRAFT_124737 [Podospora appendiculata]|uniref:Uncharacterized protein n=1 Tax=Podospora appendiculata TaxID=314037 RepID=A0AAE0X7L8_9PEZI|nr:hypothetical protein B0T22DRAFT_124737 [Podospora appendiculata]